MIEKFFEGTLYYDFPSFEVALFSLLLAFVLSTVIAFTYQLTYRGNNFPKNLFQAMVLSSIVTSMIMMAVGSNLAVGFGIIGAVAIIRFRTLIQNPRNIIFMFAGISIGIATGVYGYAIAMAGTVIFCSVAIVLYLSPYSRLDQLEYEVTFQHQEEVNEERMFGVHCESRHLVNLRRDREGVQRREYVIRLKGKTEAVALFDHLKALEVLLDVRVEERNINYRL